MEEKKLTDEEIVKAYSNCADYNNCFECPLWEEMRRRNCICREIVLGVINCLQSDITEKDIELERARNAINERDEWYAEQKAENERLTEENAILKGNPPILAGRSLGKTIRAKLLAFDKMKEQNDELQKQVYELKLELQGQFDKGVKAGCLMSKVKEQQAVKDTAKGIYKEIDRDDILVVQTQEYGEIEVVPIERLKEIIKQKGVEVE